MAPSRILVIGATGYIGAYLARASVSHAHPTFALVRSSSLPSPAKAELIESFKTAGIAILYGSLDDYASIVAAVRHVDVVISAVSRRQPLDQLKIVAAIKEVGTITRFVPSDYGSNLVGLGEVELTPPLRSAFGPKLKVRQVLEEEGIPFTYMITNWFAGFFLANLGRQDCESPPRDKVVIYGDGTTKAIYVTEEDIATYTIKAVDDPRTLNKFVHLRPPKNALSQNEAVALWESKIGKSLAKVFMTEEEMLKQMEEVPYPKDIGVALRHIVLLKKAHYYFQKGPQTVEASELYPEVKYTTVDEYLDRFV